MLKKCCICCVSTFLILALPAGGGEVFGEDRPGSTQAGGADIPTLEEALKAKTDVWGAAALRQPGGPSYEFFAKLLPPLRYVNAPFRHYPIVLSAPRNMWKARLVSNGSAINAKASATWRLRGWSDEDEAGTPIRFACSVSFDVGSKPAPFGADLERLDGPRYVEGYLPIVRMSYREGDAIYEQEAFVAAKGPLADHAAVFVHFGIKDQKEGKVVAHIDADVPLELADGRLCDGQGRVYAWVDERWQWEPAKKTLTAAVSPQHPAMLAVLTKPIDRVPSPFLNGDTYREYHRQCVEVWKELLGRGVALEVPEPMVNDAWRSVVVGCFMTAYGDAMSYSAMNDYTFNCYEQTFCIRDLTRFGFVDEVRSMIESYFDYTARDFIPYRNAAFKLRMLVDYYWLTRDARFVQANQPRWSIQAERIIEGRKGDANGLIKGQYANDIAEKSYMLTLNSSSWAGLRKFAAVLDEMGQPNPRFEREAKSFRKAILDAVVKSERRDVDPPFIPNILFADETPYEPITASRLGSYWCLIIPYVIESGVFAGREPDKAKWIMDYLQQRGGLCMGMIRFDGHHGLFANVKALDDMYTYAYVEELLRRDQPDLALVSFYGKLAQGFTRDTFIGGEGTGLVPLDKYGRSMYLPPNGFGNALFLSMLRNQLVQDWDTDDDAKPDTLRLLHGTPRRWMKDGAAIKLERAPTAFGQLSLHAQSRLDQGEVVVDLTLPPRPRKQTLLRARVPDGWKVVSATVGNISLPIDKKGTVDISGKRGKLNVRFEVCKE